MRCHLWQSLILLHALLAVPAYADLQRGHDHVVIDGVKIPFGSAVEVSGMALDPFAFDFSTAVLRAHRTGTGCKCERSRSTDVTHSVQSRA